MPADGRSIRRYDICRLIINSLRWRHNGCDSVSNHQPRDCLLNRLFRRRSKKTSKLRATGLCAGNSPETCEFPTQMASNAENVSIRWRHHVAVSYMYICWTTNCKIKFVYIHTAKLLSKCLTASKHQYSVLKRNDLLCGGILQICIAFWYKEARVCWTNDNKDPAHWCVLTVND